MNEGTAPAFAEIRRAAGPRAAVVLNAEGPDARCPSDVRAALSYVRRHWPFLAAWGWEAYERLGRSMLVIRWDDLLAQAPTVRVDFLPCGSHWPELLSVYDPRKEILVFFMGPKPMLVWWNLLPAPAEAAGRMN